VILLQALVIAGAPCEYGERLEWLEDFIPSITNWAVCDCLCSSLKSAKQHLPETWEFLQPYLCSREEFSLRFAVVMLMDHFLTEDYIDRVLKILQAIRHDGYYVNMAVAWAVSTAFVRFRDKTLNLLESQCLPVWVQNKSIQKCRESRRISEADKAYLATLRR
jgi:3-methyladenine DNA glycosylase AlkD